MLEDAERGGELAGDARDGIVEHRGRCAGAQVDNQFVAAGWGGQQVSND